MMRFAGSTIRNSGGSIVINGKSYKGNNVSIVNGTVYIDGRIAEENQVGELTIKIEGDVALVRCDTSVSIDGNVGGNVDAGGSVTCGNVGKSVDAGGSITCNNINGNADAGGSIRMR